MVAPGSSPFFPEPNPAMRSIPVAAEHEVPREAEHPSVDPHPTPYAHAVFPPSYEADGPTSRELLLDDRVERLLRENLELLKERAAMRSIHDQRIGRCNELLDAAREGHRLAAAYVDSCQAVLATSKIASASDFQKALADLSKVVDSTYLALKAWAAKPL